MHDDDDDDDDDDDILRTLYSLGNWQALLGLI
jgi:hypothetical protein